MTTKPARSTFRRTPFVGREEELGVLRELLNEAAQGSGSIVVISGEAGIGKSRLTEELVRFGQGEGYVALTGHCYEGGGAAPYLPLIEALDPVGGILAGRSLLGLLASHGAAETRDLGPEQERYALFNAARDFAREASTERPLLAVIEDVHWAGAPLVLLLRHLATLVESSRCMVVCTTRTDTESLASRLVEEVGRMRRGHVLQLGPVSEDSVAAMVRGLTGAEARKALARAIFEQTEGNPFFVEEVVKHLLEEGRLPDSDGRWTASATSDDLRVPASVRSVTERRLVHLREETLRILTAAAVIGRTFGFDLLASVTERDAETVLDCLDEAVRARLLMDEADGRLSFAHELIRQTLLSQVSAPRRQRLHLRVLLALQSREDADNTALLAHHALRAGPAADRETTIRYVTAAAERAARTTGYDEAARLYRSALELLPPGDRERRCEMLLRLGTAEKQLRDSDEARGIFREAVTLAREQSDAQRLARGALGFARSWPKIGEEDAEATKLLREAERALEHEPTGLRAMVLSRLAIQLLYSGHTEEVKSLSVRAVETARLSGDRVALARVLQSHHVTVFWPGQVEKRLAITDEMLQISRDLGIDEIALWSHRPRIADLTALGRTEEAEAQLRVYSDLADEYRQPIYIWQAAVRKAMLATLRGRLQEAERQATEAYSKGQRAGGQNLTAAFGEQMLVIRYLQGRLGELEGLAVASRKAQPGLGLWRAVLAFIYAETGREAEDRHELEYLSADNFTRLEKDDTRLIACALLAVVAARVGDAAAADDLYEELLSYAGHMTILSEGVICAGAADHYLGMLAATCRRWEIAQRHFVEAEEMNSRAGARPWLALSHYEHAAMLLARRGPGDRKVAAGLLEESLQTARELGMGGLEARLKQVLASHKGLSSPVPAGLTPREVEVLKLLASGRSNREISEELVLSLRTTARHVTNIYGKISAHNRADATAYAIRHGLSAH